MIWVNFIIYVVLIFVIRLVKIHDKRVSAVNLRLGDVGVGMNLPDNGSFSRLLPDIDCSDNEHDDIQFGN